MTVFALSAWDCRLDRADGPATISLGPDSTLVAPTAIALDTNGILYLLDSRTALIHRRRLDGTRLPPLGGPGRILGKFLAPSLLYLVGDTVVVWDRVQQRVSYLSTAGDTLGSHELHIWTTREGFVRGLSRTPDGYLAAVERVDSVSGLVGASTQVLQLDTAGKILREQTKYVSSPFVQYLGDDAVVALRRPFGHRTYALVSPIDGIILLSSSGDSLAYAGPVPGYRRTRLDLEPLRVPSSDAQRYRDSAKRAMRTAGHDDAVPHDSNRVLIARFQTFVDTVALPPLGPSLSFGLIDDSGKLLILRRDNSGSGVWIRFDLSSNTPPDTLVRDANPSVINAVARAGRLVTLSTSATGELLLTVHEYRD